MEDPNLTPKNNERLELIKSFGLTESLKDQRFSDIVMLASQICEAPAAAINLIDDEKHVYKFKVGFLSDEIPRNSSFCESVLQTKAPLMVENISLQDEALRKNLPEFSSLLQFYAGFPLTMPNGFVLGTLMVADTKARVLSEVQKNCLLKLSQQVVYHAQKEFDLNSLKMKARTVIHDVNNHAAIISGSSYFLKDAAAKPEINPQQLTSNADRIQAAIHKIVQSIKNLRAVIIS